MMLKRVVVGLDGSKVSESILGWCERAYGGTRTELILVTSVPVRRALGAEARAELLQEFGAELGRACERLRSSEIECRFEALEGDARTVLVDVARRESADAIVVGSRGQSELVDVMLGSVATFMTHHSPVPVIVVR